MRTPRPKPNKLHDELDALLDGRPVELTDELAPLVEAADALRAELASFELDPDVADRHLERLLERPATVLELPVRRQPSGWDVRRRVVAVALAAALVLVPATMASAAALPGQAMYPFKRAIEQLRVASVQWSPAREAAERTRIVDVRRDELLKLVQLEMYSQVTPALNAVADAVRDAKKAVAEASQEGVAPSEVLALAVELDSAQGRVGVTLGLVTSALEHAPAAVVSGPMRQAALDAVEDSRQVLEPLGTPATPSTDPKDEKPPVTEDPGGGGGGATPVTEPTAGPTPSEPTPSSTSPPTTSPPDPTTTTTQPEPTTTTEPAPPGSVETPGLEVDGGSPASPGVAPDEATAPPAP